MLAQRDDLLKSDQACSVKRSGQSCSGKHSSSKSGFAGLPEGTMMLAQRDDLLKEEQACSGQRSFSTGLPEGTMMLARRKDLPKEDQTCSGQLSSSKSWLVSVRRSQVQSVRACVESERQAGASDDELNRAVMES